MGQTRACARRRHRPPTNLRPAILTAQLWGQRGLVTAAKRTQQPVSALLPLLACPAAWLKPLPRHLCRREEDIYIWYRRYGPNPYPPSRLATHLVQDLHVHPAPFQQVSKALPDGLAAGGRAPSVEQQAVAQLLGAARVAHLLGGAGGL